MKISRRGTSLLSNRKARLIKELHRHYISVIFFSLFPQETVWGRTVFVPIRDESMCYNGHTWPTNLSTTPFSMCLFPTPRGYVRNVFPINVPSFPLSIHYPPPTQHPFQTYHRVIFITPKTIHTTKGCIHINCARKILLSIRTFQHYGFKLFSDKRKSHITIFFTFDTFCIR